MDFAIASATEAAAGRSDGEASINCESRSGESCRMSAGKEPEPASIAADFACWDGFGLAFIPDIVSMYAEIEGSRKKTQFSCVKA